ncbi:hypothetical protein AVEN_228958-1 [Araneus ventricosus]|uniref:Uncharacterized protein n=1 Tax=Araneus ventricosus TaxID=182803 RepID=A0A4Y2A3S6_ARAVE|nr:hypothetical protein AVEN_228958-1 [Araneus ventricosus]
MASELEECTLEEQRSVARFLWAKGLPANDIHKEMLSVYSENCLCCQAAYLTLYRNFGKQFEENFMAYGIEEFYPITTLPGLR